jgi:16S rRNA G966 N2-methylase RsmD
MKAPIPPPQHNRRSSLSHERLDTLQTNPRDPRRYKAGDRRRVVASVRRFGPPPFVVTSERVMLSGNIWLEAARLAGYDEAPVMVADHLTPAEADAFMLANVRLVERGTWDPRALGQILLDLSAGELKLDLELTGFEAAEIDLAIEGLDGDAPDPADDLPALGAAVSRPGDVWVLGEHRLLCGDALIKDSYIKVMAGEVAQVVFADPPYNVPVVGNVSGLGKVKHANFAMGVGEMSEAEFTLFLAEALGLAAEASADPSLHYICMDWRHISEITAAGRRIYDKLLNLCVWAKTTGGMGGFYRSQHELVFVFKKGRGRHRNNIQLGRFGRDRTNVWTYPGGSGFGLKGEEGNLLALHPTVKPVALIADILLDVTVQGEIVLDPFAGSGSTIIAAQKTRRRARAIEFDPVYADVAVRRWQRWTGETARLEGADRSFEQVAAERAGETA